MITEATVKTDRRDAFAVAKLLLAGVIPRAYIIRRHFAHNFEATLEKTFQKTNNAESVR